MRRPPFAVRREERTLGDFVSEVGAFPEDLPIIVETWKVNRAVDPRVAFVVPVFNQERHIASCLASVTVHARLPFELVVVCDAPTDDTESHVRRWIQSMLADPVRSLTSITLARPARSVFETLSDSVGIALSTAPVIIEVQADMTIQHPGFDRVLTSWFDEVPGLLAVSGRGAHSYASAGLSQAKRGLVARAVGRLEGIRNRRTYAPSHIAHLLGDRIGRVGPSIDLPVRPSRRSRLYLHETVMRGPLALHRQRLDELGGFGTASFFLGDDDHDLALRAWLDRGYRVGYTPIAFSSPTEIGNTRRPRPAEEQREFDRLKAHYGAARKSSALASRMVDYRPPPRRVVSWPSSNSR